MVPLAIGEPPKAWISTTRRALVLALGVDLAAALVVVPALYLGLLPRDRPLVALTVLAIAVLAVGVARASALLVLAGFPAALLAPLAFRPTLCGAAAYGATTLTLAGAALASYLCAGAWLTRDGGAPVARAPVADRDAGDGSDRPAATGPRARALGRRAFVAVAAVFPLTLAGVITLDPRIDGTLRSSYPGQAQATRTILLLGLVLLWLGLAATHLTAPLVGDAEGHVELGVERALARRLRDSAGRRMALWALAIVVLAGAALAWYASSGRHVGAP